MTVRRTFTLLCGCPTDGDGSSRVHRLGCWMGEAEGIAGEACDGALLADPPRPILPAVVADLMDAGLLRDPDGPEQLAATLDALVDAGLLREPRQPAGPDCEEVNRRG